MCTVLWLTISDPDFSSHKNPVSQNELIFDIKSNIMNTFIKSIILTLAMSLMMSSCSTTERFNINSSVDGTIYLPSQLAAPYAVVSNGNSVKVEVPSDSYIGYVVFKDRNTGLDIPIGLNVHSKSRRGSKAMIGAGYALSGIGMAAVLGGTITVIGASSNGDDDVSTAGGILAGAGGVLTGIGVGLGLPAQNRLHQLAYDYQFTYDKNQNINLSGISTKLLSEDPPKDATDMETIPKRKKATSGESENQVVNSSKAKKYRADLANSVARTYYGLGKLLKEDITDEVYEDVRIVIQRIDKTHVSVKIIESGEDFFETPLNYEISLNKQNGYHLVLDKLPGATIEISKNGELKFVHNKVNIDNIIYTLSIKGIKN